MDASDIAPLDGNILLFKLRSFVYVSNSVPVYRGLFKKEILINRMKLYEISQTQILIVEE